MPPKKKKKKKRENGVVEKQKQEKEEEAPNDPEEERRKARKRLAKEIWEQKRLEAPDYAHYSGGESSEEDSEEEAEEEDQDESDHDGEEGEEAFIDVEIELLTPREEHKLNLKSYLKSYLDEKDFNVSQLVDAIVKQDNVGSVVASRVSQKEEEDPLGVMSVMDLNSDLKCMDEIRRFIFTKAPELEEVIEDLTEVPTGLIISERLVNVPQEIGEPLLKQLFHEIKWAVKDEKKKEFEFEQYVIISRCYLERFMPDGKKKRESKKKRKPRQKEEEEEEIEELIFPNLEDEIFYKNAAWSFAWQPGNTGNRVDTISNNPKDSTPVRLCIKVDRDSIPYVIKEIEELFEELKRQESK